jgi:hypothetical protein
LSKLRTITLAGKEYPLGDFTIDQVSRIAVLIPQVGEAATLPAAAARNTIIHVGLQSGGYSEKFEDFLKIKGVKLAELMAANLEIGRAVGYYLDPAEKKDLPPGEAEGAESP